MKRFASLITIFGMLFVACDKEQEPFEKPDTIAVESVVVTPASCELTVDGEETLSVEVLALPPQLSIIEEVYCLSNFQYRVDVVCIYDCRHIIFFCYLAD